jgi:hypothetical protein
MKKEFRKRLIEFLDTECFDYSIEYSIEEIDGWDGCEVTLRNSHSEAYIEFKYDNDKDDLLINIYEDIYEATREFDWTVKYFWQQVSPQLWPV